MKGKRKERKTEEGKEEVSVGGRERRQRERERQNNYDN